MYFPIYPCHLHYPNHSFIYFISLFLFSFATEHSLSTLNNFIFYTIIWDYCTSIYRHIYPKLPREFDLEHIPRTSHSQMGYEMYFQMSYFPFQHIVIVALPSPSLWLLDSGDKLWAENRTFLTILKRVWEVWNSVHHEIDLLQQIVCGYL